jgi:putative glutathione S-transferase
MGMLINGKWRMDDAADRAAPKFQRKDSSFRNKITADGSSGFPAAPNRYHLYVSLACPWAHRTMIIRKLKKLDAIISMSIVSPDMLENGWFFETPEPLLGAKFLHEIYTRAKPDYTGRVTVPVLWDKETGSIVNNESADIIRMFESEFDEWAETKIDFYPAHLRNEIDAFNERLYHDVNNGVYKAGFARDQAAYEDAVKNLFARLDEIEKKLYDHNYLFGSAITEADIRLFTTAIRFDIVYYSHFKCNIRQIRDYPNLQGWLKEMYQTPGITETVDLAQIKRHYYHSQTWINPSGIVPIGPDLDFLSSPHGRD